MPLFKHLPFICCLFNVKLLTLNVNYSFPPGYFPTLIYSFGDILKNYFHEQAASRLPALSTGRSATAPHRSPV